MPEIILEHVSKRWGNFVAVDDLNMVIADRSFITLLGPSGCGKTTTLRMIAGLETPTEGRITIGDRVVFDSDKGVNVSPDKRDVGFLFQNYALWPHMTVTQNISFGLENLKWKKDSIKARVAELLKMLKIEQFAERYPSELSGGQQQRVAIARTLAPKPTVLFMDEPLSNLDAKLRTEMRTELKRLHKDTDSTFVYVTHDQLEAMTLSTQVCLMDTGVLQQFEPPLDIYNRPANLFVADFVGSPTMNFIDAKLSRAGDGKYDVSFCGKDYAFVPSEDVLPCGDEVIVGVRPEAICFADKGTAGNIYSTLPSGMETVVKISVGEDLMLTSVVFGDIDFEIDTDVKVEFVGDRILLFDRQSKKLVGKGALIH